MEKPLTPRQQRFVAEYLVDLNASQAYIRAGYAHNSVNAVTASSSALLANRKIAAEVAKRQLEVATNSDITIADIVQRLDEDGRQTQDRHARIRANELLGRYLGMFPKEGVSATATAVVIVRETPDLG